MIASRLRYDGCFDGQRAPGVSAVLGPLLAQSPSLALLRTQALDSAKFRQITTEYKAAARVNLKEGLLL